MEGVVIKKDSFSVIGVSKEGSHNNHKDEKVIALLWEEISKREKEIDCQCSEHIVTGICIPPASSDYFYIAGIETSEVSKVPKGMEVFTFHECTYLKFTHIGSVKKLFETYEKIWGKWLPESGYEMADGPELEIVDIQRFPDPYADEYEMDIYIPIKN